MKDPRDIILAPVVSEKSYELMETGVYTFKVHPSGQQARDPRRRRGDLGRRGAARSTRSTARARPRASAAPTASVPSPTPSGPSSPWQRARSRCSRTEDAMAIRSRKPTSPARRFQTSSDFSEVTKSTPEKSLLAPKPKTGGRNSYGRKTSRHRGGGHKQRYRIVDFKRVKDGVTAKVAAIEYDPNRTCRIALLHYADGEKAYILAPTGLQRRRPRRERPGRRHQARQRPAAALHPGRHRRPQRRAAPRPGRQDRPFGRHRRAAGRQGRRLRHPAHAVHRDAPRADRLPGHRRRGRQQRARARSRSARPAATAGRASSPQTRGVAMNPVDHPLGGGEGRTSGGRPAVSPWGKPEGRTRDKKKPVADAHRPPSPYRQGSRGRMHP